MTILNIRNHSVQVDIESELREYDFGHNARWSHGKLVASSPFRADQAPSFFVNLSGDYAGTWGDSGALDEQYSRGNFVALIAYLRGIGYEEAEEYLLDKYGALYEIKPDEPIRIAAPKLSEPFRYTYIEDSPIIQATSPYLLSRGISAEVQAKYGVGYNEEQRGFTAIPWTLGGRIATIFYRSTRGKHFYYSKEGTPRGRLLFGIDQAEESAVIVEGPIDALSWATAGYSSIAVGSAHLSREQVELIKRSRIRRLYLGGDNDEQGEKLNAQVERMLGGFIELFTIDYGSYKDANDVLLSEGVEGLAGIIAEVTKGNRLQICNINVI